MLAGARAKLPEPGVGDAPDVVLEADGGTAPAILSAGPRPELVGRTESQVGMWTPLVT